MNIYDVEAVWADYIPGMLDEVDFNQPLAEVREGIEVEQWFEIPTDPNYCLYVVTTNGELEQAFLTKEPKHYGRPNTIY